MSNVTWTPTHGPPPSMRTPTQGPTQGETVRAVDRPPADRGGRPFGSSQQPPSSTQRTNAPTTPSRSKDRYRPPEFSPEDDETGDLLRQSENIQVFNNTPQRRPPNSPRRDSYPPEAEPTRQPVLSNSRRGSIGMSASGNRPRGLSFYDAREFMKSGRSNRPESWHGGPPSRANPQTFASSPSTPTTPTRQRTTSANVEEGNLPPDSPRDPPGPAEKIPGNVQWAIFMNSSIKNHLVATIGEIVGTTMFLFFAFAGTQVANVNSNIGDQTATGKTTGFDPSKLLYISLSFGFSLMVNVWIFFRISGGLFNPAVTLALLLTGAIGCVRATFLFFAQIVGAIAASGLVLALFPAKANVRTTLSVETSTQRGLFIEAFLTAELVFTILMLAKEKHRATFIAPVGIGLALFIAELAGVYWTGGSLNPARSIGPNIVTWTWGSTHWIYWVGPIIGSLMAVLFYKFIKFMEYEMANPGQDADIFNDPTRNPYHNIRERQRIVTERVLKSLGYDPNPGLYGYGDGKMQSLGSIKLYHEPSPSIYAGGGSAPGFGPLGTPLRGSEDDAYRERRSEDDAYRAPAQPISHGAVRSG